MGSDFDSFDQGELGEFQESDLKERGGGRKYGGQLLACGPFLGADGIVGKVNRIARFDGTEWNPLGAHNPPPSDSTNGNIFTMAFLNGELYAGGDFTVIGDVAAPRLAKYDEENDTWIPVLGTGGNGIQNNQVRHMVECQGRLFIIGSFTVVDGIVVKNIVSYDGTQFIDVGNPCSSVAPGALTRLVNYNDTLIIGGYLSTVANSPHKASKWNGGTSWTFFNNFLPNFNGRIEEFGIHNGVLYASGASNYLFSNTGGVFVPPAVGYWMAKYSGALWSAYKIQGLDAGGAVIRSIISFDGKLIVSPQTSEFLRYIQPGFINATFPDGQTIAYPVVGGRSADSKDMIVWNGELVTDSNGSKNPGAVGPVASWNGTRWLQLGILTGQQSQFALFPNE